MKLLGLLMIGLGAISALKTKALHLNCEQELKPYSAVVDARCMAFALNGDNIHEAINYLKAMGIKKAYVLHWNDHNLCENPMVLYDNGTLAPFDPYTNRAKYVLCVDACTCPGGVQAEAGRGYVPCEKPCAEPCGEWVEEKVTVNPAPNHKGRAVTRCHEEYSSSSDRECEKKRCPVFPRVCKEKCKSRSRCHGCPNKKVQVLMSLKTYTFDVERYRRRGDVIVRVCSKDSKEKYERFIVSKSGEIKGRNDRRCVVEPLPKCLRCPKKLHQLKRCIERKVCQKVCLYINSKCEIFILVGDCKFYRVVVKDDRRHKKIHLKKIRGHKLRELIKHGLYGVEFGPVDCN